MPKMSQTEKTDTVLRELATVAVLCTALTNNVARLKGIVDGAPEANGFAKVKHIAATAMGYRKNLVKALRELHNHLNVVQEACDLSE